MCVDGEIEKFNEETDDSPYRFFKHGNSTTITQMRSAVNSKGQRDMVKITCEDGKISQVTYVPNVNSGGYWFNYNIGDKYRKPSGKELKHYQDSMCWPESKSQCEEAGSGQ